MTEHIHMRIDRALEMTYDRQMWHKIKLMFGYTSVAKLRHDLKAMKAKGMTVIPGEGCDNQSPEGICQGHPDKEKITTS